MTASLTDFESGRCEHMWLTLPFGSTHSQRVQPSAVNDNKPGPSHGALRGSEEAFLFLHRIRDVAACLRCIYVFPSDGSGGRLGLRKQACDWGGGGGLFGTSMLSGKLMKTLSCGCSRQPSSTERTQFHKLHIILLSHVTFAPRM